MSGWEKDLEEIFNAGNVNIPKPEDVNIMGQDLCRKLAKDWVNITMKGLDDHPVIGSGAAAMILIQTSYLLLTSTIQSYQMTGYTDMKKATLVGACGEMISKLEEIKKTLEEKEASSDGSGIGDILDQITRMMKGGKKDG